MQLDNNITNLTVTHIIFFNLLKKYLLSKNKLKSIYCYYAEKKKFFRSKMYLVFNIRDQLHFVTFSKNVKRFLSFRYNAII